MRHPPCEEHPVVTQWLVMAEHDSAGLCVGTLAWWPLDKKARLSNPGFPAGNPVGHRRSGGFNNTH